MNYTRSSWPISTAVAVPSNSGGGTTASNHHTFSLHKNGDSHSTGGSGGKESLTSGSGFNKQKESSSLSSSGVDNHNSNSQSSSLPQSPVWTEDGKHSQQDGDKDGSTTNTSVKFTVSSNSQS